MTAPSPDGSAAPTGHATPSPGRGGGALFRAFSRRSDASAIAATTVLFVAFSLGTANFLSPFNQFNVWRAASQNVFIALGQAMVVLIGGMNLSLGAIGGLTVVIIGHSIEVLGWPPALAVAAGLATGGACGLLNGFFISRFRLNSFVVTLASSFVFQGLVNGISQGRPYSKIPASFTAVGKGAFLGMPNLLLLAAVALVLIHVAFRYTVVGRQLLATGGNAETARLSGIKTGRMVVLANVLSGLFGSLAAALWVSRMGTAQPATGGDWLIVSFAVTVIGGTALSGGTISAPGFLFAGLLMALIRNGLIMLGVNVYFEQSYLGCIIMLAVLVEYFRTTVASRARRL
ncbi:MAG TPA: ABC transporter permease [Anaeromyxobacter sp.]|nr:ABC transporter permease [Anaeromyxobacter sp.]